MNQLNPYQSPVSPGEHELRPFETAQPVSLGSRIAWGTSCGLVGLVVGWGIPFVLIQYEIGWKPHYPREFFFYALINLAIYSTITAGIFGLAIGTFRPGWRSLVATLWWLVVTDALSFAYCIVAGEGSYLWLMYSIAAIPKLVAIGLLALGSKQRPHASNHPRKP